MDEAVAADKTKTDYWVPHTCRYDFLRPAVEHIGNSRCVAFLYDICLWNKKTQIIQLNISVAFWNETKWQQRQGKRLHKRPLFPDWYILVFIF